ncbi:hypothetical protein [Armatimonas sp.]|uniref:hypothetical protein n=1 Tax=Armatimonas sp. TaxID=1872638 RepID=UPI003750F7FA
MLTPHAVGISLNWLPKLISILILIGLFRMGLAHGGDVGNALWLGSSYSFAFLTGSHVNSLGNLIQVALVWATIAWIFGLFLGMMPSGGGVIGKTLRSLPLLALQFVLRGAPRLLGALWTVTLRVFGLIKRPTPPAS